MTAPTSISATQLFYDSSTTNTGGTWTWSINSASQIAIVIVMNDYQRSVSACTFGGQAMTLATSYAQSDMRTSIYYRLNPPTGNQSVAVTMSAGCRLAVVGVQMTIVGGTGTAVSNGKVGNNITVNVTTTLPDNVLICGACCNLQNITGFSGTVLSSGTSTLRYSVGYVSAPTAGSYTVTYSLADDPAYGAVAGVLPVVGVFGQQFRILGYPGL
jgi:hypothetical protein